jgi:tetratricopeptide (TPR) repeat protein
VKLREVAGRAALVMLWASLWSAVAEARNPHCAGGIQYVVQAMRDKEKGNTDDYRREMGKAVQQLEICVKEDPNDAEAIGYLGWAYAEVDSACLAGKTFGVAIKGLEAKGDKRKVEWATNNQKSYWAQAFNAGINKIQVAQQAYPDFCKKPETEADQTLKAEAEKRYQEAEASLTRASCLLPGDAQTCRNLGAVFAFRCEYQKAEAVFREGLQLAPGDSALHQSLRAARVNYANQLADEKKFDQAIQFFHELIKAEPNDPSHSLALADVYFKRAQTLEGAPREADFAAAGDAYARAAQLKTGDADLAFNAALSYQSAKQWEKAEAQWAAAVKLRPEDTDALSSWGSVLVELKRCDEAARAVHRAVLLKPQEKNLHRLLGNIYGKCGNDSRGTDELIVFLAMHNGQKVADAAAAAKAARAGSDAAKTLAAEGTPDQIIPWEADKQKFETWLYWNKKRAFTFSAGTQYRTVDWTNAYTQPAAGGTADKKK